jgi:hypothetical protein
MRQGRILLTGRHHGRARPPTAYQCLVENRRKIQFPTPNARVSELFSHSDVRTEIQQTRLMGCMPAFAAMPPERDESCAQQKSGPTWLFVGENDEE